jgi:hypothetical protein
VSSQLARDVVGILVFLPAVAVWAIAVADLVRRRDIGRRRRIVTAVAVTVLFPLALLYLLGRPPSSVRLGPETAGDPRTPLVARLEAGRPDPGAVEPAGASPGRSDAEMLGWVEAALAGDAPRTR